MAMSAIVSAMSAFRNQTAGRGKKKGNTEQEQDFFHRLCYGWPKAVYLDLIWGGCIGVSAAKIDFCTEGLTRFPKWPPLLNTVN